jgi:formylglycine-generating enzyme required for sulfatase activity
VLARLGDAREEVLTVDAMELRRVPAGRFVMGSPEGEEAALDAEHPQHELEIPYDYWVSRYPVTQAQYREFIDAGGYGEERFWPEAREHRVWQDGRVKARWEETLTPGPERYGEPWDLANHPAVGVSWYEALAFCRWVTERWRANGRLPEGWHVCLPSEAEWEKAARGGLEVPASPGRWRVDGGGIGREGSAPEPMENPAPARRYPWQGELSIERANTRESGIGTTSAVGCFPDGAGPYGCEELAGNVWEWTRSLQGDDPYPDELAERATGEDLGSEDPRVLRGGAFLNEATFARCSARDRYHPDFRGDLIGFRVSSSPFSSDL